MPRDHYVPQFYLRRFADQKKELRVFDRARGTLSKTSVRHAASEIGFYDIEEDEGTPSNLVERLLGEKVENFAALAFQRLDRQWPPSDDDRVTLGIFMAVQLARTPEQRLVLEEIGDITAKLHLKGVRFGHTEEDDHERPDLEGVDLHDYLITPNSGWIWATLLQGAIFRVAPILVDGFSWHLFESSKRVLATSDHPVVFWNHERDPLRAAGVATADEIYMPLDSRKLLGLSRDLNFPSSAHSLSRMHAKQINRSILAWSYRWVFHDPRDNVFTKEDLEIETRRPAMMINDQKIFDPGDSWTYLSEWFGAPGE